jgi:hypothetical protein
MVNSKTSLAIIFFFLCSCNAVICQTPRPSPRGPLGSTQIIEFKEPPALGLESKNGIKTLTLLIKNPISNILLIEKVGAKVAAYLPPTLCMTGLPLEAVPPPEPPFDDPYTRYSIPITINEATEKEVVVVVPEGTLVLLPGKLAYVRVSIFPNIDYLGACLAGWKFDVTVFLVYKDTTTNKEDRIVAQSIRYTPEDFVSRRAISVAVPRVTAALKSDLTHANPSNRAEALRSLVKSEIDRGVIEGITLNKLKDDPSEDVKVAAAYVAGEMEFIDLGSEIHKQLKLSQNANHIRVYLWALARLRHSEAVDTILSIIVNPKLRVTEAAPTLLESLKNDSFEHAYPNHTYTPVQALRKLNVPFEIAAKTRELLIRYKSWSKKTATKEQRECYASLCAVALRYRDMESVPLLVETAKNPDFLTVDSPYLKYWYDFIAYESITNSNDIRKEGEGDDFVFDDDGISGLSPIDSTGVSVMDAAVPKVQFESGMYSRHSNRLISSKFLLKLKPVFEMIFNQTSEQAEKNSPKYDPLSTVHYDPVPMVRADVFSLLSRMPVESKQREILILRGFQDKDPRVREEAARIVGVYKLEKFAPNIILLIKNFNDNGIRHIEIACAALRELRAETKMCPR